MSSENPYQAPQFEVAPPISRATPQRQTFSWMLFSFEGRIPRRVFWGITLLNIFVFYLAVFALIVLLGEDSMEADLVILILYIPMIWISLAVTVKRWHDRDKSGWWILIQLIPIVGPIWAFIETGCLRGTIGSNQYGEDPT